MNRALRNLILLLAVLCQIPSLVPGSTFEARKIYPAKNFENASLNILGTTDLNVMEKLILEYLAENPNLTIRYDVTDTKSLYEMIATRSVDYDLAISSAMDLQFKLVNDGFAQTHRSSATGSLPKYARWRDRLFGFSSEPIFIVYNTRLLPDGELPKTRFELLEYLRQNPARFKGKIVTYDITKSGTGYFLASQDSLRSETFWRLMEVFGALEADLSASTSTMLGKVQRGEALIAYNVIGTYIRDRAKMPKNALGVLPMNDYNTLMLRSALIPASSKKPETAGKFIDYLIASEGESSSNPWPELNPSPIHFNPGLLVFLDGLKRQAFKTEWLSALGKNQNMDEP